MESEPQPSFGLLVGREHQLAVRVYYEDTDFTGAVYHANYVRYLERGRSDFLRVAGLSHAALLDAADPAAFAVTAMELAFRKPARVDDALLVRSRLFAPRGARLAFRQSITRGADTLVDARVEVCCITPQGRPRRLPEVARARLGALACPDASSF